MRLEHTEQGGRHKLLRISFLSESYMLKATTAARLNVIKQKFHCKGFVKRVLKSV